MARRHDEDRYREQRRRFRGDPHEREEDESYGQYGGLDRGLGYGGGRDIEESGRFGRGRRRDRYPRGGGYREHERGWQEPGWQEPGWQEELHARGRDDRRERGFLDRASDEVASWFGDEDAARRREADHRGKGPRGYRRSDARIEEDVNDRLTDDPAIDATDVAVTVAEGEVTLSGHVDSRHAKRRAEDCAESVSGVRHVQNNLRVRTGDQLSPPPQGGGTV